MDVGGRSTLLKCRSVGTFLCFCPYMNQLVEALECCYAIMAGCCMPIAIAFFVRVAAAAKLQVLLLCAADLLEDMALGWGRQAAMRNA